jgi:excinuclease ABC subunit A
VKIWGKNISDVARMTIEESRAWTEALLREGPIMDAAAVEVIRALTPEVVARLRVLGELGLGYLTLDRSADTLSTGEAQRIRVAAQLGSSLTGVLFVLDEPTVGLHPRDTRALSGALLALRDRGNTVVVVEHDEPVIRMADHVVDLGPRAGPHGGSVVAEGPPGEVARAAESLTGRWLRGEARPPAWPRRRLERGGPWLTLGGITLHNLRELDVRLPLGRLVCVTGVSGSGKSTLVRDVMLPAVQAKLGEKLAPATLARLELPPALQRAVEVDESPIGRTPRSVPATYVGVMDPLRSLYAQTPEARARGWGSSRFSFNVAGGRCEKCEGQGRLPVRMSLLPEVYVPCEACEGRRFHRGTLAVRLKGKSVADALDLTVDEARELFSAFTQVRRPLDMLAEIGLGYLTLGQPSPTLSGGEAQRIKIAAELSVAGQGRSLYVLDEPTTGLHMDDVARLVGALQRLVDRGDSVVVIEHNLEVIAAADYVIDLGPEGGARGGQIVACGTPEEIAATAGSRTAPFLREMLEREAGRAAAAV